EKGAQFRNSVESWQGISVSDPVVSGNHFAVQLKVDLTFKGQAPSSMDELIVFKVEDGKIAMEEFFY
ncbi:MAG: SnoaL-like domain-containing protein, partial [Bacteroidota bacterium]